MKLLSSNCDIRRACKIFHNFTGSSIIWLSEIQNNPFVNNLDILTEFSGIKINCSTCKNNVEYPPPHTCDMCTSMNQKMYCMWEAKE